MAIRKAKQTIQEFALIRGLQRRFARSEPGLVRGIGDDAAVIAAPRNSWWHLTTDLLAEGVHFDLKTACHESVGYRAAMANLSDIAAMGAVPRYLLTSLAIPKTCLYLSYRFPMLGQILRRASASLCSKAWAYC